MTILTVALAIAISLVTQFRLIGGSIGIAASGAILGVYERKYLFGFVSESDFSRLAYYMLYNDVSYQPKEYTTEQIEDFRGAYGLAFRETMIVCTVISALSIPIALLTFRTTVFNPVERRREQVREEAERVKGAYDSDKELLEPREPRGLEMNPL